MHSLINTIERFIDWSGRAVSWLTLLMVIVTFIVVVLRYVFDTGWIALQESISYMHAMVFLIGASWAVQQEAHVRVDIFYSRFSSKTKAWIDMLGGLLLLLPVMIFVGWISWEYVIDSWDVLEGSREAGGLPGVFLLKTLILVLAGLLVLQAGVQVVRSIQTIRSSD
ncbi:MAG: TRAP transporter small permease subunit [Gammaproteobacteria bacterium]|jgi:TRAP-type mannitol/chloroaromatic compound transport system permease small subunit